MALNSGNPYCKGHIYSIQRDLIHCSKTNLLVQFLWVPSHVGIVGNEKADELAKAGSRKRCSRKEVINTKQFLTILKNETKEQLTLAVNNQSLVSCTLNNYYQVRE